VRKYSLEELFEMDLEGQSITEGYRLSSLEEAYELYRTGVIDLRTLDRLKGSIYKVLYSSPKGTRQSVSLVQHSDGHWIIYQQVYVPGYGED